VQFWHEATEAGGLEVPLAAINNHLSSYILCGDACLALFSMIVEFKENTEQLISLGVGATVYKVRTKWPHIDDVYDGVLQHLNARITTSQPTVRSFCMSSEVAIGLERSWPFLPSLPLQKILLRPRWLRLRRPKRRLGSTTSFQMVSVPRRRFRPCLLNQGMVVNSRKG
jgi:hypothetical protein